MYLCRNLEKAKVKSSSSVVIDAVENEVFEERVVYVEDKAMATVAMPPTLLEYPDRDPIYLLVCPVMHVHVTLPRSDLACTILNVHKGEWQGVFDMERTKLKFSSRWEKLSYDIALTRPGHSLFSPRVPHPVHVHKQGSPLINAMLRSSLIVHCYSVCNLTCHVLEYFTRCDSLSPSVALL